MEDWYISEVRLHRTRGKKYLLSAVYVLPSDEEETATKVFVNGKYLGYASVERFWALPIGKSDSDILTVGIKFSRPKQLDSLDFGMTFDKILGETFVIDGASKSYKDNITIFA